MGGFKEEMHMTWNKACNGLNALIWNGEETKRFEEKCSQEAGRKLWPGEMILTEKVWEGTSK